MAMTVTIKSSLCEWGQKCVTVRGTIVFSGSYATGGETWNLTTFAGVPVKKQDPVAVGIWGAAGYGYGYVPVVNDLSTGKLKISTTAATELLAGAYPAGITGDVVMFEIVLPKLV